MGALKKSVCKIASPFATFFFQLTRQQYISALLPITKTCKKLLIVKNPQNSSAALNIEECDRNKDCLHNIQTLHVLDATQKKEQKLQKIILIMKV